MQDERAQKIYSSFFIRNFCTMELQILSPVSGAQVRERVRRNQLRMHVDEEEAHLVNPGETVTSDQQFMR